MRQANGRVGRVDPLPAGTRGAKAVHADVLLVHLHVHVLGLRQDRDRGRRRVDAAGGLGLRYPLHPVDPAFVFEARIRARPFDESRDGFQAADPGVIPVHDLDLPAPGLGVPLVHPEELSGKKRGLLSSRPRSDLQEDAAGVVRVLREQQDLQFLLSAREAFGQLRAFSRGELAQFVSRGKRFGQLPRPREFPLDPAVLLGLRDDRLEFGKRLLRVAHGPVVLDELRVFEAPLDLVVLATDLFQSFQHSDAFSVLSRQLAESRTELCRGR